MHAHTSTLQFSASCAEWVQGPCQFPAVYLQKGISWRLSGLTEFAAYKALPVFLTFSNMFTDMCSCGLLPTDVHMLFHSQV